MPIEKLTDEKIIAFFRGANSMTVLAKIPEPTYVPGGGYWLNEVEVDLKQLIDAYRKHSINESITMGNKCVAI